MTDATGTRDEGFTEDGTPVISNAEELEAAEEAARTALDEQSALDSAPGIERDEPWVPVATAPSSDPGRSLEPVYEALCEAGIPASFDPYRPGVASSPQPFLQRTFSVVVPESRLREARDSLARMDVRVRAPARADEHGPRADAGVRPGGTRRSWLLDRRLIMLLVVLLLVAFAVQLVVATLFELGALR